MKNIAIVCGGYSGEYPISVQSAEMVKKNLDKTKYISYIIFIEKIAGITKMKITISIS